MYFCLVYVFSCCCWCVFCILFTCCLHVLILTPNSRKRVSEWNKNSLFSFLSLSNVWGVRGGSAVAVVVALVTMVTVFSPGHKNHVCPDENVLKPECGPWPSTSRRRVTGDLLALPWKRAFPAELKLRVELYFWLFLCLFDVCQVLFLFLLLFIPVGFIWKLWYLEKKM